ncbi:MAG: phosphodiesterase [Roseiarcus sp.]
MIIAQLSDLHVRPRGEPYNRVGESSMLAERALRACQRLRPAPDALILTGDLVDNGKPEEYAELVKLIRRYAPGGAHGIPGNHDRRAALIEALAPPVAATGFVDYAVDLGAARLVMLDSLVEGEGYGTLRDSQLDWLDATLAERAKTPTMVALHHPPFATGIRGMDAIGLTNAEAFAAVILRHPQVERIVCGHCHRQIVARVGHAIATVAPSTAVAVTFDLSEDAAATFVKEPPQFTVHLWSAATGFVSHTVFVEDFEGPYPFLSFG